VDGLIAVPLPGGGSVLVEAADSRRGTVPAGRPAEAIQTLNESLDDAMARIRLMAELMSERLRELHVPPEEITVEFGVKVSAEAGLVVARTAGEASFGITLRWQGREE
jgi:alkanesulfonate monooxygenase SsuD/methylene tetrahydromethanopterin reductase-like flavin-dependent oxidoreductase (luciferase family)